MASMLFNQLYQQALERDHVKLGVARELWHSLDGVSIPACGRLADGVMQLRADFEEQLNEVVIRNRMRIQNIPQMCPQCHSDVCPGAVPLSSFSPPNLKDLLKGGPPSE